MRCCNFSNQKKFFLEKAHLLVSSDYWLKYKRISAKLRQVVRDFKWRFWNAVFRNAGASRLLHEVFWKIKNRLNTPQDSHFVLDYADSFGWNAKTQVECFADHFNVDCEHKHIPLTDGRVDSSSLSCPFTFSELNDVIHRTKISTPVEDKKSVALFKVFNNVSIKRLLHLFSEIWLSHGILNSWTSAVLLPILKPREPEIDVSSYRPINSLDFCHVQSFWNNNFKLDN